MSHSTIEPTHSQAPHSQEPSTEDVTYHSVATTPQYQRLRSGFLRFAFPMTIAAMVSYFAYVPLAFLAGFIGTMTSQQDEHDLALAEEMEVRSMTGAGAGAAINH